MHQSVRVDHCLVDLFTFEGLTAAVATQRCLIIVSQLEKNGKSLLEAATQLHAKLGAGHPLRLSVVQCDLLEEWPLLKQQRSLWHGLEQRSSIAHLAFPTEMVVAKESSARLPPNTLSFLRQFNSEGWITYTRWMGEEVERVLAAIPFDASEEYSFQAELEHFRHEVRSPLLQMLIDKLHHTIVEGSAAKRPLRWSELENEVIVLRERLCRLLLIQSDKLQDLVRAISIIEDRHPELLSLKTSAILLHQLLESEFRASAVRLSWQQQLLLLELLDAQLGVVSAHQGASWSHYALLMFYMRLAMAELDDQHALRQGIDSALDPAVLAKLRGLLEANCRLLAGKVGRLAEQFLNLLKMP